MNQNSNIISKSSPVNGTALKLKSDQLKNNKKYPENATSPVFKTDEEVVHTLNEKKNLENATSPIFKTDEEAWESINNTIQNITKTIRKGRDWLGKPGICENCGHREATHNLDLKFGSHRECGSCWYD